LPRCPASVINIKIIQIIQLNLSIRRKSTTKSKTNKKCEYPKFRILFFFVILFSFFVCFSFTCCI
jgi:ABC-type multidrug transport system permease subunit